MMMLFTERPLCHLSLSNIRRLASGISFLIFKILFLSVIDPLYLVLSPAFVFLGLVRRVQSLHTLRVQRLHTGDRFLPQLPRGRSSAVATSIVTERRFSFLFRYVLSLSVCLRLCVCLSSSPSVSPFLSRRAASTNRLSLASPRARKCRRRRGAWPRTRTRR